MYGTYYGMTPYSQMYGDAYGYMRQGAAQTPQMPQMPQNAPTPQPQSGNGLIWVQGEAGAKSHFVPAGGTVMLMDSESSVFYLKTADASGMPLPLRIFDYAERPQGTATAQNAPAQAPPPFDTRDFVTRGEFDAKMAQIAQMMQAPQVPINESEGG